MSIAGVSLSLFLKIYVTFFEGSKNRSREINASE